MIDRWVVRLLLFLVVSVGLLSIGSPLVGLKIFYPADMLADYEPFRSAALEDTPAKNPLLGDTVDFFMPLRSEFRDRLGEGDYPLWTSLPMGGFPLGTVSDSGSLGPLNLPYLLLPTWYAPAISKLLEIGVAIVFTWAFLRRVGLGHAASMIAGLIYAYTGFQVVWTHWPQTHVGALVPALFWAAERVLQRPDLVGIAILGMVGAAMLFEGFPSVTGYAFMGVAGYALARLVADRRRPSRVRVRSGFLVTSGLLLAMGLASMHLLPLVSRVSELDLSYREQGTADHLDPVAAATAVIPTALGSWVDRNYFGPLNEVEAITFVGASSLILVAYGAAVQARRRLRPGFRAAIWGGASVSTVLIFMGGPLLAVFQMTPLFEQNNVARLRSMLGFFVAILAGMGMQTALDGWRPGRRRGSLRAWGVFLAFAVGAAFVGIQVWDLATDARQTEYLMRQAILPLGVAAASIGVLWTSRRLDRRRPLILGSAFAILFGIEALAFAWHFWPHADKAEFYPTTPAHRFLQRSLGHDRAAMAVGAMYPGATTYFGIRSLTSNSTLPQAETWRTMTLAAEPEAFDLSPVFPMLDASTSVATSPILDRLGTRYFVTSQGDAIIGRSEPVSAPSGEVVLGAGGERVFAVPPGRIRGVIVTLTEPPVVDREPVWLRAHVVDGNGQVLARGGRRIYPGQPAGALQVPVAECECQAASGLHVRLSLDAVGVDLALASNEEGRPAASLVVADDDGLRLEFVDGVVAYRRLTALSRIRWAGRARVITNPRARLGALLSGTPMEEVVLSRDGPPGAASTASLEILEDGDEISVSVEASGGGYLVVADPLQTGWRAELDGDAVPLVAADHAGVGVFVPQGSHSVAIRYEPPAWRIGLAVSVASLLLLLGLLAWAPLRRTTPATDDDHLPSEDRPEERQSKVDPEDQR